jgi:hypothetical protein
VKALSLWQPWAAAIALGLKAWETRSYATSYRGVLAIHAAKRDPLTVMTPLLLGEYLCRIRATAPSDLIPQVEDARGAIVAVVRFTECRRTKEVRDQLSEGERFWGDYADDRYAWRLEGAVPLLRPVPIRGQQMIWTLSATEAQAVEAAMPRGVAA